MSFKNISCNRVWMHDSFLCAVFCYCHACKPVAGFWSSRLNPHPNSLDQNPVSWSWKAAHASAHHICALEFDLLPWLYPKSSTKAIPSFGTSIFNLITFPDCIKFSFVVHHISFHSLSWLFQISLGRSSWSSFHHCFLTVGELSRLYIIHMYIHILHWA